MQSICKRNFNPSIIIYNIQLYYLILLVALNRDRMMLRGKPLLYEQNNHEHDLAELMFMMSVGTRRMRQPLGYRTPFWTVASSVTAEKLVSRVQFTRSLQAKNEKGLWRNEVRSIANIRISVNCSDDVNNARRFDLRFMPKMRLQSLKKPLSTVVLNRVVKS